MPKYEQKMIAYISKHRIFAVSLGLFFIIFCFVAVIYSPKQTSSKKTYLPVTTSDSTTNNEDECNILNVDVSGYITSYGINSGENIFSSGEDTVYSEDVKHQLDVAKDDDKIKAVLLTINSYGGNVGAAKEIVYALENLDKPVVAVIRTAGVSAGYWIAVPASKIYAYETADVGSIGVTSSFLDETGNNTKEGKYFVSLSSGKFKDMGNPDKTITAEEKVLMMRDIKDLFNIFVKDVSIFRGIPEKEILKIADGSSVIAYRAKDLNLIDEIGSTYDAIEYLGKMIERDTKVCQLDDEE